MPVYKLLEAAAHGYIAVDHRLLHAILDRPERAVPDLARFASEDRKQDPLDLEEVLDSLFRYLATPDAIPFYMQRIRRDPLDIPDELLESMARLGASAVDPLLDFLREREREGRDPGDLPFLLAALGVHDTRIYEVLVARLDGDDVVDAAVSLEMYGDPAAIPALENKLGRLPAEDARDRHMLESAIEELSLGPRTLNVPRAIRHLVRVSRERHS